MHDFLIQDRSHVAISEFNERISLHYEASNVFFLSKNVLLRLLWIHFFKGHMRAFLVLNWVSGTLIRNTLLSCPQPIKKDLAFWYHSHSRLLYLENLLVLHIYTHQRPCVICRRNVVKFLRRTEVNGYLTTRHFEHSSCLSQNLHRLVDQEWVEFEYCCREIYNFVDGSRFDSLLQPLSVFICDWQLLHVWSSFWGVLGGR